jgi:hypothetical protein
MPQTMSQVACSVKCIIARGLRIVTLTKQTQGVDRAGQAGKERSLPELTPEMERAGALFLQDQCEISGYGAALNIVRELWEVLNRNARAMYL